jgi:hypothetical protein
MSSFGDEQLNNISQSLEEIENYLSHLSADMNRLVQLLAKHLGTED